jgi:uncharacterized Zn finger protein
MIIIKENIYVMDNVFKRHTKKTVRCTACGRDLLFFDVAPASCHYCNAALFNMQRIIKEQGYRIIYHFGALGV